MKSESEEFEMEEHGKLKTELEKPEKKPRRWERKRRGEGEAPVTSRHM